MADDTEKNKAAKPGQGLALWMPIGLCLGISLGQLSDNLGLGISLGLAGGTAIGVAFDAAIKKRQEGASGPDA
ncbi:hypothetical protein ACGFMM_02595 [Streptomyces sp. NPDC048604]|uniref:hypothetical protein n=1 Tax=Streptomyces sp. NPDC048604 TaxID=3365578 RepID=UPI00371B7CC4